MELANHEFFSGLAKDCFGMKIKVQASEGKHWAIKNTGGQDWITDSARWGKLDTDSCSFSPKGSQHREYRLLITALGPLTDQFNRITSSLVLVMLLNLHW